MRIFIILAVMALAACETANAPYTQAELDEIGLKIGQAYKHQGYGPEAIGGSWAP